MAFNPEQPVTNTPTTLSNVTICLRDRLLPDEVDEYGNVITTARIQDIRFHIQVNDQNGHKLKNIKGDLQPHLTAAQITQLQAFLDTMVAKAIAEILPT